MNKLDNITKVFLNTWGAYNNGCIGYGWMEAEEAKHFIKKNPERDGGEFFVADIDNFIGIPVKNLEYCNVMELLEDIIKLEELDTHEAKCVIALMEEDLYLDVSGAIEELDNNVFWSNIEEYHNFLDEEVQEEIDNYSGKLAQYFDYEAYYRTYDLDIFEASNGICILKH
jgi:antirestriction protein